MEFTINKVSKYKYNREVRYREFLEGGLQRYNLKQSGEGRPPLIFESRGEKGDVGRQFSMGFLHFCMSCEQDMSCLIVLHYVSRSLFSEQPQQEEISVCLWSKGKNLLSVQYTKDLSLQGTQWLHLHFIINKL